MKGLIVKDGLLVLTNKRMFLIMIFITALLMITNHGGNYSFIIAYFVALCAMMTLTTISFDDNNHSGMYLMTMPVTRRIYALEKYVFTLLLILVGTAVIDAVVTIVLITSGRTADIPESLIVSGVIVICLFLVMCIMLPLQLKFGADNGRIVMLGFLVAVFAVAFALAKVADTKGVNITAILDDVLNRLKALGTAVIALGTGAVIILFTWISTSISIHIMNRKQL